MVSARVTHSIDGLARDCRTIAVRARKDMTATVREGLKVGNTVARDNAKRTAGTHGKLYPRAFSVEMYAGGTLIAGEYGPDAAMPQGGMSFEGGSRNQPPHLDMAKSADLIGYPFAEAVGRLPDKWFW